MPECWILVSSIASGKKTEKPDIVPQNWPEDRAAKRDYPDLGKIILKVISDQIKISSSRKRISNQIKITLKKIILIWNQDQRSFFVPFYRCRCRTQKRTSAVAFVMKQKQHNDPQYADCCSTTRAAIMCYHIFLVLAPLFWCNASIF
jgi:hypothetical protein